jgi:hypothetical protein
MRATTIREIGAPRSATARLLAPLKERVSSIRNWDAALPAPPAARAKHTFLARLAHERRNRIFIESGTYLGDTTLHMAGHCETVITVELDPVLYERARRRFEGIDAITVVHGDAADTMPELVRRAAHPPLVWLDGHYSGGETAHGRLREPSVAILRELRDVERGTTIVVDDLRLFGRKPDLPTLGELVEVAAAVSPRLQTGPDCLVVLV